MTASRYAGQADASPLPRTTGQPGRSACRGLRRRCPPRSTYPVREGDRLDLLAAAAFGDSTAWWRIADANPCADALADTEPGNDHGDPRCAMKPTVTGSPSAGRPLSARDLSLMRSVDVVRGDERARPR